MASEGKAKSNKQMTITFTLPISCQICLGKVKQPVLCPNHHVFCSLCLEIWLNRNQQCPACRVDIGPDNPVRHIIGNQLEEEISETRSTPEFRRARFDLLYREYEDELEKLQKDNVILKMQNSILTSQLQDAEHKNMVSEDKRGSISSASPQTPDGLRLLQISRNLQEVQKLYQGIRVEMAELKQENCRLKEESVNLTRENENLRLEIAQRSPKKFGRYTVATLETKLAEQEKEIRQLKKALERSDAYIEELQQQDRRGLPRYDTDTPGGKARFHINLEPKGLEAGAHSSTDGGGPRKVLFGKVIPEEAVKPDTKANVFSTLGSDKSSQKYHRSLVFSKNCENLAGGEFDSLHLQKSADVRNVPETSSHSEAAYKKSHDLEESIQVSSQASLQSQPDFEETAKGIIPDKTMKKVHFKDSEKASDTASFDLEVPSPISSLISESYSSFSKDLSSPGQKLSLEAKPFSGYHCQVKLEALEGEEEYGRSSADNNVLSSRDQKAFKKPKPTLRKNRKIPVAKKIKQEPVEESMEDSSHLSVPDITPTDTVDNVSHIADYTETSDDFDMSMTPEMTDCLRLFDQAEKKVSSMASTSSGIVPKPDSVVTHAHQTPWSSGPPNSSAFILQSSSGSFPPANINSGHRFASTGNNIRGWQQQFYNALKVNPDRVGTVYHPPDVAFGSSHYPRSNDHLESGNKSKMNSFMNNNPSKNAASAKDFTFSEPLRVTAPFLDLPDSATGRKQSSLTNPFTSGLSFPGPSTSSSTFPSSFTFMTPPDIRKDSYHHSSSTLSLVAPSAFSHTNSYVTHTGRQTGL
ncbi:unnamed protein product [Candidula unifasciata]|uniref:RING-type domain-containing protein n=1 Tax=Candidula unifasciata TaxID=100452 RepID=A0A8S3ZTD8_9EUPU|nr:unnamed protein product [Candidula unifasciata]